MPPALTMYTISTIPSPFTSPTLFKFPTVKVAISVKSPFPLFANHFDPMIRSMALSLLMSALESAPPAPASKELVQFVPSPGFRKRKVVALLDAIRSISASRSTSKNSTSFT